MRERTITTPGLRHCNRSANTRECASGRTVSQSVCIVCSGHRERYFSRYRSIAVGPVRSVQPSRS